MTRRISVNVGGLWRTSVELEEEATWWDLKNEIEKSTGISTIYQKLTPTGKSDERCELEEGDDVFCDWEMSCEDHPLHYAAMNGNTKAIRSWIASYADVNVTNILGETPLIFAAYNLRDESVAELLCLGADAKLVDKKGNTTLHYVASKEKIVDKDKLKKIVKMLIKAGCDPMTRDSYNETFVDMTKQVHGKKIATKVKLWIKEANGEAR